MRIELGMEIKRLAACMNLRDVDDSVYVMRMLLLGDHNGKDTDDFTVPEWKELLLQAASDNP